MLLYDKINAIREALDLELSPYIKDNLVHRARPYQEEALLNMTYYLNDYKKRVNPTHLLFHMATGSGKTYVMAGAILELYKLGYRNFIFFVNSTAIVHKTKQNFLAKGSAKYLFKERICIDGKELVLREVEGGFDNCNSEDLNIRFTTIQALHTELTDYRENGLSFEDFEDKKLVLISDEAHHINATTKGKSNNDNSDSWEDTVERLLRIDKENVLLEFTATIGLNNEDIKAKYEDKIIYDYPLKKYCEDKYSKNIELNKGDLSMEDRALVAVLCSYFKQKIFAKNDIIAKPVILFKSQAIKDSEKDRTSFVDWIKNLDSNKVKSLISKSKLLQEMRDILYSNEIPYQILVDELKGTFTEERIVCVNSQNKNKEEGQRQIILNTLEDEDNECRVIFAVNMLDEGWDVLNLYDIVMLYDKKTKVETISNAQLIGRGARYYPFEDKSCPDKDRYKRRCDEVGSELAYCETLHYHCGNDNVYITDLKIALKEQGLAVKEEEKVKRELRLKDAFKKTKLYEEGKVFVNSRIATTIEDFQELFTNKIRLTNNYVYKLSEGIAENITVLDDGTNEISERQKGDSSFIYLKDLGATLVQKAMHRHPFYSFNNIKYYYPKTRTFKEFIQADEFLGKIRVELYGVNSLERLTPKQKLSIAFSVLDEIATEIKAFKADKVFDWKGSKEFKSQMINKVFMDKTLYFSLSSSKEVGRSTMEGREPTDDKYVNLDQAEWYAYTENYGTAEEKFLVKFLSQKIDDLKKGFTDIYLLRNERFFRLYSFDEGQTFEPDYVLFLHNEKETLQLFVEPKGNHLLLVDVWKENFLKQIEQEHKFKAIFEDENFKLIGLPFYNKEQEGLSGVFEQELDKLIK